MKFGKWLIALAIVGISLFLLLKPKIDGFTKILGQLKGVPYEQVSVTWSDQNWTQDEWDWWYHVSQGSALESIIPYDWFVAMEKPSLSPRFAGDFIKRARDPTLSIAGWGGIARPTVGDIAPRIC
ncbi:MAG: hypothetical protein GDA44_06770 [Prochloron sp. SP5CPC1]|nr:hypothetical protein [Candidatus Paraprochloron terpiosi SP5CPC1]